MRVHSIQVSYLQAGMLSDCFTKNQNILMKKANIFSERRTSTLSRQEKKCQSSGVKM